MKKFFVSIILAAIAVSAFIPSTARADEVVNLGAVVLNNSQTTAYHVLNSPSDILSAPDGLYVRSETGYEIFKDGNFTQTDIDADRLTYADTLISLKSGSIYYGETTVTGSYTQISACGDKLYALDGNSVHLFTCAESELIDEGVYKETSSPIGIIAATDTGCMYTVSRGGYTDVFDGENEIDSLPENVLSLGFGGGNRYVLTSSSLILYTGSTSVIIPAERGAFMLSVSDRVYVLTQTGSVISVSLDLNKSETIIASSGNMDWFYTAPAFVSTRLDKIYIADRMLNRVAVIDNDEISYVEGLIHPSAVAVDNGGTLYVAHGEKGNKVAVIRNGEIADELTPCGENKIVDLEVDYDNKLYCLTESGQVSDQNGEIIRETGVKAMEFQSVMHYMTDGYIDDKEITATDFCLDIMGNIFAVLGNKLIAVVDGVVAEYTVSNAISLVSVTISKVENDFVSYGDVIMVDEARMCAFVLDGELVGSADAKQLFTPPQLSSVPNAQQEGLIGKTEGAYMFALPIEGKIVYELGADDNLILLKEAVSPEPFVYCAVDAKDNTLVCGYVYRTDVEVLDYAAPKSPEAKINAENTPIYKYPSVNTPEIASYKKNTLVTLLPFAVTAQDEYGDSWYVDDYGYKWYRIAVGTDEGFVLASNVNTDIFSNEIEMPKPNATVTEEVELYRYDAQSDEYIKFTAAGTIPKGTRVEVATPFDTSKKYTKVRFYRDGLGTIEVDCYVETQYIDFDGVDIVKIVAICAIALALVILIIVIVRRRRIKKLNRSREAENFNQRK